MRSKGREHGAERDAGRPMTEPSERAKGLRRFQFELAA